MHLDSSAAVQNLEQVAEAQIAAIESRRDEVSLDEVELIVIERFKTERSRHIIHDKSDCTPLSLLGTWGSPQHRAEKLT